MNISQCYYPGGWRLGATSVEVTNQNLRAKTEGLTRVQRTTFKRDIVLWKHGFSSQLFIRYLVQETQGRALKEFFLTSVPYPDSSLQSRLIVHLCKVLNCQQFGFHIEEVMFTGCVLVQIEVTDCYIIFL